MILRFLLGTLLAAVVAAVSLRARLLSRSGAVAAAGVGALAVMAGWSSGILLVVFFTLTAGLSAHRASRKREITRGIFAKDTARDAAQVLANGGVFALAAVAYALTGSLVLLAAAAGAIAAAAADTWATEIGIAFGGVPRSIRSWKSVQAGTSGAITAVGSLGGLAGAAAIAATVLIIGWPRHVAAGAFFAGVSGMVIDSVLGATIQCRRHCPGCDMETEQIVHHCGRETKTLRGVPWIDNDAVNTLATISGAMIAVGIVLARA